MSSNSIGKNLVLTSFGESHGPAVGCVLDGFPSGFKIDFEKIQSQLNRRRPGQSALTTERKEDDQFEILSGIFEGKTLGTPITVVIANKDSNPKDYENLKNTYRPGHADVLWQTKMGHRDHRGGGRSSARITAPWVAAGALAEQFLSEFQEGSITVTAWVQQVHNVSSNHSHKVPSREDIDKSIVRCPNQETSVQIEKAILQAKEEGDSLGGSIRVAIQGVKAGLGSPIFRKLNAILSYYMLNINAVKGIYFGEDNETHKRKGSENNDTWIHEDGAIKTQTNHAGGIVGGMSSGSDILFEVFFKPTSSISKEQQTINSTGESVQLKVDGRHDPCVLPRAVPIVESMCALAIMDLILDKINSMNRDEILEQFSKLLDVMNDLREKCPWDMKQTWESIRVLSIEEVHELSDAIMEDNPEEVKKELGDILLHIVFYSKIAMEKGYFDVGEVCQTLIEKLIRRHPHIYGDVKVDGQEEVLQNWEQIKLKEKGNKKNGLLDGVPKGLTGIVKAYRMQEKASQVGFDWDEAEKAYEKVEEEWAEYQEAQTKEEQEEEFGDYLFALINYARLKGINPDNALEKCNIKFKTRFESMEAQAEAMNKGLKDLNLEQMEELWQNAKKH